MFMTYSTFFVILIRLRYSLMTQLEQIKKKIEQRIEQVEDFKENPVADELRYLLSFIDSLEKEQFAGETMMEKDKIDAAFTGMLEKDPHYTKRNELFDKCVANVDPEVMKAVSDDVDRMIENEQAAIKDWMVSMDEKYAILTHPPVDKVIIETAQHFYALGCSYAATMYDDLEFERQRGQEEENRGKSPKSNTNTPKIKGWVARCKWPCPDELYFYRGEEKPIRCGSQVEDVKEDFYWDFQHEVAPLDPTLFPDLSWEDEPIEVELTIHKIK